MPAIPKPIPHTSAAVLAVRAKRERPSDWGGIPASAITSECERQIWYRLHWAAAPEPIAGERAALLSIGRAREYAIIEDLRDAGLMIDDCDFDTGRQHQINLADGWLKGRMDGIATRVPEAPAAKHVLEIKSVKGTDFRAIQKHGVAKHKPDHYAQVQLACLSAGAPRGLYVIEDRESGDVHSERVEADPALAMALEAKALRIGEAQEPPEKNEGFWCSFCPAARVCQGEIARRNCRTCLHATMRPGSLTCAKDGEAKAWKQQQAGCPGHRFLPSLVPGEQIDVRGEDVVYRLADGAEWVDGGVS